jgi:hypothetical protein
MADSAAFTAITSGLAIASSVVLVSAVHYALWSHSLADTKGVDDGLRVPFSQSCWLILSSLSFLVPAVLALFYNPTRWWLICGYSVTFLVSVNYWRRAEPGIRRDVDLVVAKLSFAIVLGSGLSSTGDQWRTGLVYAGAVCTSTALCYSFSVVYYRRRTSLWILAHACFHFCVGCGMAAAVVINAAPSAWAVELASTMIRLAGGKAPA